MLKRKGFTLIEMLVVVLIIGIIAAIALPQYQIAVLKSRYTQAIIMSDAIGRAAETYYLANGSYPSKLSDLDVSIPLECTLNADGSTLHCPKLACGMYSNVPGYYTVGSAFCYVRGANGVEVSYIRALTPSMRVIITRYCMAPPASDFGKKLCERLGGRFSFVNSGNGLWYYTL